VLICTKQRWKIGDDQNPRALNDKAHGNDNTNEGVGGFW
jgi:hypothetical protein